MSEARLSSLEKRVVVLESAVNKLLTLLEGTASTRAVNSLRILLEESIRDLASESTALRSEVDQLKEVFPG